MDDGPPGSSVHRISQARILKWVVISFSRGSSRPRDQTHISSDGRILYHWATRWFSKCIFNWRIIALQCCAGFCHTTTLISHNYMYVCIPSFFCLPPDSHPTLCHHRVPGWASWAICFTYGNIHVSMLFFLGYMAASPLRAVSHMMVYICQCHFFSLSYLLSF